VGNSLIHTPWCCTTHDTGRGCGPCELSMSSGATSWSQVPCLKPSLCIQAGGPTSWTVEVTAQASARVAAAQAIAAAHQSPPHTPPSFPIPWVSLAPATSHWPGRHPTLPGCWRYRITSPQPLAPPPPPRVLSVPTPSSRAGDQWNPQGPNLTNPQTLTPPPRNPNS
jgi:hypothetical protein